MKKPSIPITKPLIGKPEIRAVSEVLKSGWITQGPRVGEFEEQFARYVGARYACAVSSCTTALHLAMVVAGVGRGDEVICPSMSFIATANAIAYTGATPIFADVDERTFNINPEDVARKITPRTKAILIVHQMGMPAELDELSRIASEHKLQVIEDAACAVGSQYRGKKIGTHSSLVCFSFHPRKIITTGEGGMITTDNKAYLQRLRLLRHHGMSVSDVARHTSKDLVVERYEEVGYNYRMTDMQAALGIVQLSKIDEIIARRRHIAEWYRSILGDHPDISIPFEPAHRKTTYQSYCVTLSARLSLKRDLIIKALRGENIAVKPGIMLTHLEKPYRAKSGAGLLPVSEELYKRTMLLPLYPSMKRHDVALVAKHLISALDGA